MQIWRTVTQEKVNYFTFLIKSTQQYTRPIVLYPPFENHPIKLYTVQYIQHTFACIHTRIHIYIDFMFFIRRGEIQYSQ